MSAPETSKEPYGLVKDDRVAARNQLAGRDFLEICCEPRTTWRLVAESPDVSEPIWSTRGVFSETSDDATSTRCVRRAALERRPLRMAGVESSTGLGLWFVKVTLGGEPLKLERVRSSLSELSVERAFLVSARYDANRAEIAYWDEGDDVNVAIDQAFSLWGSTEVLDALPGWKVVGLEVLDRIAARAKWEKDPGPRVFALGEIAPFE